MSDIKGLFFLFNLMECAAVDNRAVSVEKLFNSFFLAVGKRCNRSVFFQISVSFLNFFDETENEFAEAGLNDKLAVFYQNTG